MSLVQLDIHQVRNLTQVSLQPSKSINIIFGENAGGKTSLLEAIHILSSARSFRTTHINHIIQRDKKELRVFGRAELGDSKQVIPLGIERTSDTTQIRINNQSVSKSSELAAILPVQIINPDVHKILEQGPKYRRQFLDWGVFHVEHAFLSAWQQYHRVLRQRNAALRSHSDSESLKYWDNMLVEQGMIVSALRQDYLQALQPYLEHYCQRLIGLIPEVSYQQGWSQDTDLASSLVQGRERDMQQGFTRSGPHRADVVLKHQGHAVQSTFSRGQQKMLVSAMRLAQIAHLKEQQKQTPVLLVDDLAAELDQAHRMELFSLLVESGAQLFVTVTEAELLDVSAWDEVKMFHVEHGKISEVL